MQASPGRSSALQRAGWLLYGEGLVIAALGLAAALSTASGQESFLDAALGLAATALLSALALAVLGRAVLTGRGWARTPALVLQLVALPVGTDQLLNGQWAPGPAVLLLAGATAFHLLAAGRDQT